jgi:hypothetical protein
MSEMFPLVGHPVKVKASWQEAEIREKPLLLNPYTANPSEHLMFTHEGEAVPRSEEGKVTIEVLQLNRPNLVTERARSFMDLRQTLIENTADSMQSALNTYVSELTEFPGASLIFLQNLCRVAQFTTYDQQIVPLVRVPCVVIDSRMPMVRKHGITQWPIMRHVDRIFVV